jgi:predicted transcriptional regulator YheO
MEETDKQILETLKTVVDGIAAFLGPNCEALLHSFENLDHSIVHICNGHITGRTLGSPITDLGMKLIKDAETQSEGNGVSSYYTRSADGKILRSTSILIRNNAGKPIGMLCVNFNMSAPLSDMLAVFTKPLINGESSPENFAASAEDLVKTALEEAKKVVNTQKHIPNHVKNKAIVFELIKKGIFDIRGAVTIAAKELSLTRYTIYNYIREYKKETNPAR